MRKFAKELALASLIAAGVLSVQPSKSRPRDGVYEKSGEKTYAVVHGEGAYVSCYYPNGESTAGRGGDILSFVRMETVTDSRIVSGPEPVMYLVIDREPPTKMWDGNPEVLRSDEEVRRMQARHYDCFSELVMERNRRK